MNDKLTDIIKTDEKFWLQVGTKVKTLVLEDADKGILPNGTSSYRSKQYKKYKANGMNRFSDGKRLKGFGGSRISTNISAVTMKLTGRLWQGFQPQSVTKNSVDMAFRPQHRNVKTEKILEGNKVIDSRRDLLTLSDKNNQIIFDMLNKELDGKLTAYCSKDIIHIIK